MCPIIEHQVLTLTTHLSLRLGASRQAAFHLPALHDVEEHKPCDAGVHTSEVTTGQGMKRKFTT
jgi:hypothetical protein